jgi:hypothetical protein
VILDKREKVWKMMGEKMIIPNIQPEKSRMSHCEPKLKPFL